jgi:hypothetical protein
VQETMKAALVPDSLAAMTALGAISASIGAGLSIQSGSDRVTPGNLFILGIAPSGTGKGNVFHRVFKPYRKIENEAIEEWQKNTLPRLRAELKENEGHIRTASKTLKNLPPDIGPFSEDSIERENALKALAKLECRKDELERQMTKPEGFSVADVTREQLAISLSEMEGEALASISPEARGVIDVLSGRYSQGNSSDEDIYLSSYSRESFSMDRVNRPPVRLKAPCLSIVWMIQPDVAKKFVSSEGMMTSGLIPRFLLADTGAELEDEPIEPHRMAPATEEAWGETVKSLLQKVRTSDEPAVVEIENGVWDVIRSFTNEVRQTTRAGGRRHGMESIVARWGENAWRIALVLHAAAHGANSKNTLVSVETAKNAVIIMRWFISQQEQFLQNTRRQKAHSEVNRLKSLLRENGGSKSVRDLKRSNKIEEEVLKRLVETNPQLFRIEDEKNGGRPSPHVKLLE